MIIIIIYIYLFNINNIRFNENLCTFMYNSNSVLHIKYKVMMSKI